MSAHMRHLFTAIAVTLVIHSISCTNDSASFQEEIPHQGNTDEGAGEVEVFMTNPSPPIPARLTPSTEDAVTEEQYYTDDQLPQSIWEQSWDMEAVDISVVTDESRITEQCTGQARHAPISILSDYINYFQHHSHEHPFKDIPHEAETTIYPDTITTTFQNNTKKIKVNIYTHNLTEEEQNLYKDIMLQIDGNQYNVSYIECYSGYYLWVNHIQDNQIILEIGTPLCQCQGTDCPPQQFTLSETAYRCQVVLDYDQGRGPCTNNYLGQNILIEGESGTGVLLKDNLRYQYITTETGEFYGTCGEDNFGPYGVGVLLQLPP